MSDKRPPKGPGKPGAPRAGATGGRTPTGRGAGSGRGSGSGRAARPGVTPAEVRERPGGRRAGRSAARAQMGPAKPAGSGDRIAKLLARAGVGSRRDIERMIAEGRVALEGKALETPATILTSLKGVTVDGKPVAEAQATRVFLFHKPAGVLTAARDPGGRPTIYDVLPATLPRLVPVGRLDLNTEGLLLLTNDGELKRALELPSSEVPRTYRVRAMGEVRQQDLEALAMGVTLEGVRYGPVDASVDRRARAEGANIWLTMTLTEGKNREVRKLCDAMGLKVSRLIRTVYGPFNLGDLEVRGVAEVPNAMVTTMLRGLAKLRASSPNKAG
jgi:23S rRNA pseudouridine2605 synthase